MKAADKPIVLVTLYLRTLDGVARVATAIAPPVLRVALALPFLRSGMTRWDGFGHISASTLYLFENLFQLHILGGAYPLPAPDVLAHVTAFAEIGLPILLFLGLATRFAALGLLGMTAVIQLIVPDGWANFHLYWASIALAIIALGPGVLSIDALVSRFLRMNADRTGERPAQKHAF